jgi:hypothetical protein
MDRALAVGATSGSFSVLIFRLLSGAFAPGVPLPEPFECPVCPEAPEWLLLGSWQIEPYSLGLGLLLGVSVGPILELLYLLRQTWRVWLQSRLVQLAEKPGCLYRLG